MINEFNTGLADIRKCYPDRFITLAGLPLDDITTAKKELRRARLDLGHMGAILPAGYFTELGHLEKLRSLFETGDDVGAHFMIHPGPRNDQFKPGKEDDRF